MDSASGAIFKDIWEGEMSPEEDKWEDNGCWKIWRKHWTWNRDIQVKVLDLLLLGDDGQSLLLTQQHFIFLNFIFLLGKEGELDLNFWSLFNVKLWNYAENSWRNLKICTLEQEILKGDMGTILNYSRDCHEEKELDLLCKSRENNLWPEGRRYREYSDPCHFLMMKGATRWSSDH